MSVVNWFYRHGCCDLDEVIPVYAHVYSHTYLPLGFPALLVAPPVSCRAIPRTVLADLNI